MSDFEDDNLDPEFYDANGNLLPECYMGPDGHCDAVGSEECDECPEMEALLRRLNGSQPVLDKSR